MHSEGLELSLVVAEGGCEAALKISFSLKKAKSIMVKSQKTKSEDKRKPKHGLDATRPSKGGKNMRDAATVRFNERMPHSRAAFILAVLQCCRRHGFEPEFQGPAQPYLPRRVAHSGSPALTLLLMIL